MTPGFAPRLLFLTRDPALVRDQLAGRALARADAGALRDDISTDEIAPLTAMVHFDAALGCHAHTGYAAGGERPIGRDAIRAAGITVIVGGRRYGKGSSREHSVVAELSAGIRLVIADSFERIYRQNADNLGLLTSTDLALADRIQRGEPIALDGVLADRDAVSAAIVRAGGLLAFVRKAPQPAADVQLPNRPLTLFEKIVLRHGFSSDRGFVRADWRFIHEYYTGMCAWLLERAFGANLALHDPATIVAFEDHLSYVHRSPAHVVQNLVGGVAALSRAHRAFVARFGLRDHGYVQPLQAGDAGNTGSQGISHAMMAERYALPGQVVVGTDSHTPHSGALGCVAFGVGSTDMASAFVDGRVRMAMPGVLRVELAGVLPAGVTAKDVALHLLADPLLRRGAGVGCVFEFGGAVVRAMATDERTTLTNMTAEMGGFSGIVEPDAETMRFLRERRGIDWVVADWMHSDAGARYDARIEIDCSVLAPMVAAPGDPGNGIALSALTEPVPIDIAYGGSCTAGKRDDFDHYHAVLAWAAGRGMRVAPGVRLLLQFGTEDVRDYCVSRGYLAAFEAVGAELLQPACGACANCGPGSSDHAGQVTVSAINRNFPGRSGPGQVWLASPPTVAASAIAGRLVAFRELREMSAGRPAS